MLLQNILSSSDERLCKKVIKEQRTRGWKDSWYGELVEEGKDCGIDVEEVECCRKSEWKKEVKCKLRRKVESELEDQKRKMSKLEKQIGQKYERQQRNYLKE